ncbi:hypothetical protein MKK63_30885 [Methylobacterium sp. J-088]|uniref:hypothetical protein n=1 Tax=Methylobacterium sp. J-088 TaxID=2836664 RepID=UPI001FBB51F4|nr:hypothetical protein [Methylobacterium sp. J-088]MCJ2067062.1 hypothetical protein [Methylobacterium sp. J-088]
MSDVPTPQQALILWCLLGRGGTALQGTLVPKVEKADREALIAGGYLEAGKEARALRLTVTDKGWNWAGTHMDAPLPPAFRTLQDWLERIGADLAARGRPLAEFVGPVTDAPPEPPPTAKGSKAAKGAKAAGAKTTTQRKTASADKTATGSRTPARPGKTAGQKKPLSPKQLRARIEAAYLALTGGERARAVRLSALRAELGDLDRATVDAGLGAILGGDKTARLSQFSDPRSLDDAERGAAFSPAGEPFHILRIQS